MPSGVHLCTLGLPSRPGRTMTVLWDDSEGSSSKKLKGRRKKPTALPGVAVLGMSSEWGTCRKPTVTQATRSCTQGSKHYSRLFWMGHRTGGFYPFKSANRWKCQQAWVAMITLTFWKTLISSSLLEQEHSHWSHVCLGFHKQFTQYNCPQTVTLYAHCGNV